MVEFGHHLKETKRLIAKYGLSRNGHSHFGASGSAGWLNCDGYVLANAGLPDNGGGDAAYGTVGHSIAAEWLLCIRDHGTALAEQVPLTALGSTVVENGFSIIVDEVMIHHVRRYIDWCAKVEHLGHVLIEQKVDYSKYTIIPQQGGTVDHAVLAPGLAIITDLKLGVGVPVYAEETTQLPCYGVGLFLEWDWLFKFQKFIFRIAQPRRDYFDEREVSREWLLEHARQMKAASIRGWRENAPRTPGPKQCQWCADKLCVAKSAMLSDIVSEHFEVSGDDPSAGVYTQDDLAEHEKLAPLFNPVHAIADPVKMSTFSLARRKKYRHLFDAFFREIDAELLRREAAGEKIPGFKRVNGRRSFSWIDEETARTALLKIGLRLNQIEKTEIVSKKRAEELLRTTGMTPKEVGRFLGLVKSDDPEQPDFEPLVKATQGKPTLAPMADGRVDWSDEVAEAFGDDGEI